jgi:hypothetical protein
VPGHAFRRNDHNPERLLNDLLPRLFRGAKYVPIYYPLLAAGRVAPDGSVTETDGLPANARALLSGTTKLRPYGMRGLAERRAQSFQELLAEDRQVALDFGLVCSYEVADVVALRDFLGAEIGETESVGTMQAKLSCKYDRLVYGPDFEGRPGRVAPGAGLEHRLGPEAATESLTLLVINRRSLNSIVRTTDSR